MRNKNEDPYLSGVVDAIDACKKIRRQMVKDSKIFNVHKWHKVDMLAQAEGVGEVISYLEDTVKRGKKT